MIWKGRVDFEKGDDSSVTEKERLIERGPSEGAREV